MTVLAGHGRNWRSLSALGAGPRLEAAIRSAPALFEQGDVQTLRERAKRAGRTPQELIFLAQCEDFVLIPTQNVVVVLHFAGMSRRFA
jgi:hypothetical protein